MSARRGRLSVSRIVLGASLIAPLLWSRTTAAQPGHNLQIVATRELTVGAAKIQVDFAAGQLDLSQDAILAHIQMAAKAVAAYYGRFPVARDRILVVPWPDRDEIGNGTTWGNMAGFPAMTRIHVGQHATQADLNDDWMMTHELVHDAFPNQQDDQHWIEEGLAVYVEPLARVMTGELSAQKVWHDMARDMHQGEPQAGDQGLDHTHTWGRTYWGGALFCLVADVEIRRETHDQKGLRDALRAIVAHGGTIEYDWDLSKAFAIGDAATGTHVLSEQYAKWKDTPVTVDLDKLWADLGVQRTGDHIEFVDSAPLAGIRKAIAR
jgi:hypothetical protein